MEVILWWCGSGSPAGDGGVGDLDPLEGLSGMRDSGRGAVVGAG